MLSAIIKNNVLVKMILNAGWLSIGRMMTDVASLVLYVTLARSFGASGAGQYAYGFAIAGMTAYIISWGLDDYLIRECSHLSKVKIKLLLRRVLGLQTILLVVISSLLFIIIYSTGASEASIILLVILFVYHVSHLLARTMFAPSFAHQKMAWPAFVEFLCSALPILASILMMTFTDTSMVKSLLPIALGMIFFPIAAYVSMKNYYGVIIPSLSIRSAYNLAVDTWHFSVSAIIFYFSARIGIVALSLILGDVSAGLYATAMKIIEVGSRALNFLSVAGYPALSKNYNVNDENFKAAATRLLAVSLYLGALFTWGLFFIASPLMVPVFGEELRGASSLLQGLSVLGILIALDMFSLRILFSMHLQRKRLRVHFVGMIIMGILSIVLIYPMGIFGCVAAAVISYSLMIAMYFRIFNNRAITLALLRYFLLFLVKYAVIIMIAMGIYLYYDALVISAIASISLLLFMLFLEFDVKKLIYR